MSKNVKVKPGGGTLLGNFLASLIPAEQLLGLADPVEQLPDLTDPAVQNFWPS